MSASQQKRLRKQQREDGTDKRLVAQKKEEKKKKRSKITKTIVGVVAAILVIALIAINSSLFYSNFTAVKIGDIEYTAAEYNFFYNSIIQQELYANNQLWSMMGLDVSKPLDKQEYMEGKTWADFFKETALEQMKEITALYSEAQKAGFTLSDEDKDSLISIQENLKTSHKGSNFLSANSYLAATYGKGCNVKVISGIIEKEQIARAYEAEMNKSFTYTDNEIKAYYADNKDTLDNFTYLSYLASTPAPESDTETDGSSNNASASSATDIEESEDKASADAAKSSDDVSSDESKTDAMAKAKTLANSIIADAETADEFKRAVLDNTQEEISENTVAGGSLNAAFADWLKDASRTPGDKTVIETDNGCYALFFISRDDNNYRTANVRHILTYVDADESGNYTDEAKAEAKKKSEDLLNEWKSGDATEESFAKLADENSDDPGSNTNGGLYENVYKGAMVPEFDAWCFEKGRKPGDTGIVYNEGKYYGYHVIYYVGEGMLCSDKLAEDALRGKDFSDWKTSVLKNYEATTGFTAVFVK